MREVTIFPPKADFKFCLSLNVNGADYLMKPYITNVDPTHPIGLMVEEYGEYQWKKGFLMGHMSGLCVGLFVWILLSKKT